MALQQNLWVVQSVAGALPQTPGFLEAWTLVSERLENTRVTPPKELVRYPGLSFDTRQQCPKSSFKSKVQNDEGPNTAENHTKATILALSSQLPPTDSAEEA